MASEVLMTISRDQVERARLMSEFKYEVDTRTHVNCAVDRAKNEVAQKMKAMKLSIEQIEEATGLTESQIDKL